MAAVAALAALTGAAAGCEDDFPAATIPDDRRRNVMVIDEGIDLTLPELRGKVSGAHTVACDPDPAAPDAGAGDGGADGVGTDGGAGLPPDIETLKREMIAELARPDESCHLRPGIGAQRAVGSGMSDQRQRWNQALRNDDDPFADDLAQVGEVLAFALGLAPYHGTATAGTVAFAAPGLRLVLVEQALMTSEEIAGSFSCLDQASIDLVVTLLSFPEVREAYLASPLPAVDRELAALRAQEQVALVNESFGPLSRIGVEALMVRGGCRPVDLHAYFRVLNDLTRSYDRAHAERDVLFVRAAGNDGAALNDEDDGVQCRPDDQHQLLVGAYGTDGKRPDFTNFGTCVDVYAPGEFVVVPVPGDWLMPLSGTSFAAPLALRRLLFLAPTPFTPQGARAALIAEREPGGNIPVSLFPRELVFDARVAASKRSLSTRSQALAAPTWGTSATGLGPRLPSLRAYHRATRLLRWAERNRH